MQEKVIRLGNELVALLGLEPGVDTLSKWMAYYIAEQIIAAETATGSAKSPAERRCYETILLLWEHRASFPPNRRPLENFDPILRALEQLDPAARQPFYFNPTISQSSKVNPDPQSIEGLIKFVFALDKATRVLIEAILEEAASKAATKQTKSLIKNAIRSRNDGDIVVIRRLIKQNRPGQKAKAQNRKDIRKRLTARIKTLNAFCSVCATASASLKKELQSC